MNNAQRLKILLGTGKTVFNTLNMQSLWNTSIRTTKIIAKRMADQNIITRIDRGYYALYEDFNIYELANLIISPSYVSFHSSLFYHGIVFQVSNQVYSVSRLHYQRKMNTMIFSYYAMKESLFFNLEGIDYQQSAAIAKPERALLDSFYFNVPVSLDAVDKINKTYLAQLSMMYPRTVQKRATKLLEKL